MDLAVRQAGEAAVVTVGEARLDAAIAIEFKEAMRALQGAERPRVVLDLGTVEFLDSSGLGAVVAVMKHFAPERRLELAALKPAVERVFRLTRMDSVFAIHPSVADATSRAEDMRDVR